ncbi:MAG: tetratricopeptide repeat protein [Promethearchaeota archaeon]|jgi:tetratricopeptide (TPR) repeat protein
MSDAMPKELKQAEKLMNNAKYADALKIIDNYHKNKDITEENYLTCLILKGYIFQRTLRFKKALKVGEQAYQLSKKLGTTLGIIDSLIIKSSSQFLGRFQEGDDAIKQAEKLLETLKQEPYEELLKRRVALSLVNSTRTFIISDYEQSFKYAMQGLDLAKKLGIKLDLALVHMQLGMAYLAQGDHDQMLKHELIALKIFEEFQDNYNIANCFKFIGDIYTTNKGELDKGLENYNRSLAIKECPPWVKVYDFIGLGNIFLMKGELNKALDYLMTASRLAEEIGDSLSKGVNLNSLGALYTAQGDLDQAFNCFERYMNLGEELGIISMSFMALYHMVLTCIYKGSLGQAQDYMDKIEEMSKNEEFIRFKSIYDFCEALLLKASNRISKLTDAERLLKQIVEDEATWFQVRTPAIINLCDLLLSELKITNNSEVIDDLNPLITQLTQIAEDQHSFSLLAEAKLLQGRLELIKLNLDLARKLLTLAQKIADEHGLELLAQKISYEHDFLLKELETWQNFKKTSASVSKRLELAPVDDITERMLGKRVVEPTEIVDEQPILLLIMSGDGVPYFNHSFNESWDFDDLFSSFMSAFNTFSSEIFSKSIDRIKMQENFILIKSVESFLVCYVIKGQSYPALQKLSRFSDAIKWKSDIWESLNRATQTNEVLDLNNPPSLGDVINEIFNL